MYNFKQYLKGCRDNVDVIYEALESSDIILTKEEQLDYYFKFLLHYRAEVKNLIFKPMYRVAQFYYKVFKEMKYVVDNGYDNKTALQLMRKINRAGYIYLGTSSPFITGRDRNGSYFFIISNIGDDSEEFPLEVYDVESLVLAFEMFSQYIVSCSKYASKFNNSFMTRVINFVCSDEVPQPYMNMSVEHSVSHVISENANIPNVLNFEKTGGNTNGRSRGIHGQSGRELRGAI